MLRRHWLHRQTQLKHLQMLMVELFQLSLEFKLGVRRLLELLLALHLLQLQRHNYLLRIKLLPL